MPTPLRVGFDLMFLGERSGGVGRYVQGLLRALLAAEPATKIVAFVGLRVPHALTSAPWATAIRWVRLPLEPTGVLTHRLAQRFLQPALARGHGVDLFHNAAALGPTSIRGVPIVVTLFELIWSDFPQTQWASRRVALRMARAVERSVRCADRILTATNVAADAISLRLGASRDRIDVVPLGIEAPSEGVRPTPEPELRQALELGSAPVIACVSQKLPHKNLDILLPALVHLEPAEALLVLPGSHSPYESELRESARRHGVEHRVRFPDWLSEEDLEGLYSLASCVVLPSLVEGFGFPALEAMARQVPVACSDRWAFPEIAADAALFFDPESAEDARRAMQQLLNNRALRRRLIAKGVERASEYTWGRTARATLASYRKTIAAYRGRETDP
jgi:glycosyltransferase involved in cell wall biosynthesis